MIKTQEYVLASDNLYSEFHWVKLKSSTGRLYLYESVTRKHSEEMIESFHPQFSVLKCRQLSFFQSLGDLTVTQLTTPYNKYSNMRLTHIHCFTCYSSFKIEKIVEYN